MMCVTHYGGMAAWMDEWMHFSPVWRQRPLHGSAQEALTNVRASRACSSTSRTTDAYVSEAPLSLLTVGPLVMSLFPLHTGCDSSRYTGLDCVGTGGMYQLPLLQQNYWAEIVEDKSDFSDIEVYRCLEVDACPGP